MEYKIKFVSIKSMNNLHESLDILFRNRCQAGIYWYSDAIEIGAIKIPEIQKQYAKIKDELEAIDYKKTMAKYQLDNMNNRLTILNRDIYNKRNEIAYLQIGYVRGLENHNQQQQEIQNE